MKKISELRITKQIMQTQRDSDGKEIKVQVPIETPFKVNTVHGGARFGHYILDLLIIFAVLFGLAMAGILGDGLVQYTSNSFNFQVDYEGFIAIFLYYMVFEATLGRTPGKFATNSFVIDDYGNKPDTSTIFIRTICRLVPFESLSCLVERGWHDKWSNTYVVTQTEWNRIRAAMTDGGFSDDLDILDA